VGVALVIGATALVPAQPSSWRVQDGDVRVKCPMTFGGSFEARTSSLTGTLAVSSSQPAAVVGDLAVDLGSLDTGINLRNTHLREKYLETARGDGFDRAVLSNIELSGGPAASFEGRTPFTGSLLVHGTQKPIAGQAQIARSGGGVRVDATFPVTLSEFGIAKPRYLGVGVKDVVQVRVMFTAVPANAPSELP
jgi:polyisoprenoid-binding protein YceI